MDNALYMEHAWKYYEKCVGMWAIESGRGAYTFPLSIADIEGVAREYFHYFDNAMRALEGFFTVTAVEYPPGETVMASPMPLDLYEAKHRLLEAWKKDSAQAWAPGAIYRGLADVAVRVEDKLVSAGLPDTITVMFSGLPGSDRYVLFLTTNCDIWLNKTIPGAENPVGSVNALRLKGALGRLEDALDGKVVRFATEYDGVPVTGAGFG
ncbi:MAG TPA: hypothetical protein VMC61_03390 [Methanocella sp.]|nr:hypothetical protein [Methanocella sp.]